MGMFKYLGECGAVCVSVRERVRNSVWVSVCECESVGESVDEGEGGSKSVDGSISEGVCKNVGETVADVSVLVADLPGNSTYNSTCQYLHHRLSDLT